MSFLGISSGIDRDSRRFAVMIALTPSAGEDVATRFADHQRDLFAFFRLISCMSRIF
jgi:hypothetical protein